MSILKQTEHMEDPESRSCPAAQAHYFNRLTALEEQKFEVGWQIRQRKRHQFDMTWTWTSDQGAFHRHGCLHLCWVGIAGSEINCIF